ncbi:MAG: NFACT RNA binding domain-containing protein [Anaerolineae bacterium]|nr:NFACT RNA binding domain-containing protein [Anaerolineae bacterium]
MNFDVFTIAAITAELNNLLRGGRVQDTLELGDDALGLEIYSNHARHYLYLSAHPQQARLHLVPDRLRRGVENPSPLGLMLRRHIEGSRFAGAAQPAWERVVHLTFLSGEGEFTLIAEPMERRGNLLLVQNGQILDCIRRVGADENRMRVSLPAHPYVPPPPQTSKRDPSTLTLSLLTDILSAEPSKLTWRLLTEKLLGFSPMLAKEAVFRATGKLNCRAEDCSASALLAEIQGLVSALTQGQFAPHICEQDGQVIAYAAYPITHLPNAQPVESMSAALNAFYGAPIGDAAYANAKKPVQAQLQEAIEKVSRRLDALKRSQRDEAERERLRQCGELILAYQYQIARGQTSFSAQYDFDAPPLEIALDPMLTPLENAQRYFEQYEKAKRAAAELPSLIAAAEQELDFLRQLETDLALAANYPEIGEVQDALQANGYWRGTPTARPRSGKSAPLKVSTPEGFVIWIGRNARQNEEVTFTKGSPDDLWLHARGIPGAHVIVKSSGRDVPNSVLERAASLAAYYSAARNEAYVPVDVTERRYVRKIKGGKIGMVTYRNEFTLNVPPRPA